MAIHLTNDNRSVFVDDAADNLAGVTKDASHLVCVQQQSNWTDKELVVTPSVEKFAFGCAWGIEANPNTKGGISVLNDTNVLINRVNTEMAATAWTTGKKALVSYFTRAHDPNALYNGTTNWESYSGFGQTALALQFNLRHLPLSKMSSFTASLRAYCPSRLHAAVGSQLIPFAINPGAYAWYNNASQLKLRIVHDLPEFADASEIETSDCCSWEMYSHCNNGNVPANDNYGFAAAGGYDFLDVFNHRKTYSTSWPVRVYMNGGLDAPTAYYTDLSITGDQKTALMHNTGKVWFLLQFHRGNAFAIATDGQGLDVLHSATLYVQRFELVLKCTGNRFNY